jgi:hypothetical protein
MLALLCFAVKNIFSPNIMEPSSGFEPETPSLPWKCSTTELRRLKIDYAIVANYPYLCYTLYL